MMSVGSGDILRVKDAAEYLGVSVKMLYTMTSRREIPFYKPSGKLIFFLRSELDSWVMSKRINPIYE